MRVHTEFSQKRVVDDWYAEVDAIESPIAADRQGAKRHYGVHPYFTRRPFNVVRRYIFQFSKEGDVVLDPFGGSGITAIEAFLGNRTGVQNDINPLANFIAAGVANLSQGQIDEYKHGLHFVRERCTRDLELFANMSDRHIDERSRKAQLPANIDLPSNSDVSRYRDLFSPRQLLSLSVLKNTIGEIREPFVKSALLLAWSATLAKINRTFLSAEGRAESRGGSSIFSIYRYKVAKSPVELPIWRTFEERAANVIAAKCEVDKEIELRRQTSGWKGHFESYSLDIGELVEKFRGSVDYIFTDPPYGGHISYLDLSVLWNHWLSQMPSQQAHERELIVGGELQHSEDRYVSRLRDSIAGCLSMLRPHRWLSVVFQHWNIAYFEAILEAAQDAGAELRAAVSQVGDPIWSMHKKKGKESVLAGELILTFFKSGRVRGRRQRGTFDIGEVIERVLSENTVDTIFGEYLFNRVIVEAWKAGAIASINISRTEFVDLIQRNGWHYDEKKHMWSRNRSITQLFQMPQQS